jgi:hypothetical protein
VVPVADPSSAVVNLYFRALNPSVTVSGVGLRQLDCWDCEFGSRRGHGYLCLVSVVCCQVEVCSLG